MNYVLSNSIMTCPSFLCFTLWPLLFGFLAQVLCVSGRIEPGSKLLARQDQAWYSDNRTFALGFAPMNSRRDQFQLGVWFAQLRGDRVLVWSADMFLVLAATDQPLFCVNNLNRSSPLSQDATFEFQQSGNLILTDRDTTFWASNTSISGVQMAYLSEKGNFLLYGFNQTIAWQSFAHPSDTLLPGQSLTASSELKSSASPSHGGYYTLKMLQQRTSLSLALTYNLPRTHNPLPNAYANLSYWAGPDISNVTGNVTAVLSEAGSFGIVYGASSDGAVYVYKNDNDSGGLYTGINQSSPPFVIRRLVLETNGNLRLYRWDNDVNGSAQWVAEWAAVSNPCDIAGICGNGICRLDRSKTNASCTSLPGNSSLPPTCGPKRENSTSEYKIVTVQQSNYYFSDSSVLANYSDIETVSKCGDACLTDCDCVASVYGLNEEKPYCWVLRGLDFGGFEDASSTLFVKVPSNGSWNEANGKESLDVSTRAKVLVLPIVLSFVVLIALLCSLLYIYIRKKRALKEALDNSLIVSSAPVKFSYRDLHGRTNNFSQLLGRGGFGSVFKGTLSDGTYIAVKKLDRILPHGEKEFITEVNTIGSMHHMNLVRLCGYCADGPQRLLVYEFMINGSLDKWIFPSFNSREVEDRLLDWSTRFNVAVGTAQGIAYFHEQCRDRIIHCDIKPENILLDEHFCPKVSDFGLAKIMGREASHVFTMIRGTRGYLAPEWVSNRPITVKADVYSYGMLLLEMVGGRRNLDMTYDAEDFFYPGWAFKEMTNGTPKKVVDRRLEGAVEEEEVARALKVAFWCIQDEIFMRPTMGEVVKMLEGSADINMPPMPQSVLELVEEGLDHVYRAMKREFNQDSSFTIITHPSSKATCSYSSMSPR